MLVTSIFSFFQNVSKSLPFQDRLKSGLYGKELTLSQTSPGFCVCSTSLFENTVGKGEIVRNEQFLLFQVFSTHLDGLCGIFNKFEIVVCLLFQFGRV